MKESQRGYNFSEKFILKKITYSSYQLAVERNLLIKFQLNLHVNIVIQNIKFCTQKKRISWCKKFLITSRKFKKKKLFWDGKKIFEPRKFFLNEYECGKHQTNLEL